MAITFGYPFRLLHAYMDNCILTRVVWMQLKYACDNIQNKIQNTTTIFISPQRQFQNDITT